ncbi:MAG TPA: hypothetical protein VIW01_08265 [Dehalococcoidia bacterium]
MLSVRGSLANIRATCGAARTFRRLGAAAFVIVAALLAAAVWLAVSEAAPASGDHYACDGISEPLTFSGALTAPIEFTNDRLVSASGLCVVFQAGDQVEGVQISAIPDDCLGVDNNAFVSDHKIMLAWAEACIDPGESASFTFRGTFAQPVTVTEAIWLLDFEPIGDTTPTPSPSPTVTPAPTETLTATPQPTATAAPTSTPPATATQVQTAAPSPSPAPMNGDVDCDGDSDPDDALQILRNFAGLEAQQEPGCPPIGTGGGGPAGAAPGAIMLAGLVVGAAVVAGRRKSAAEPDG